MSPIAVNGLVNGETLGFALYVARARSQLRPKRVASSAAISESYLHQIESGMRVPSARVILALTSTLSLPPSVWAPLYAKEATCITDLCQTAATLIAQDTPVTARPLLLCALQRSRLDGRHRHKGEIYQLLARLNVQIGHFRRANLLYNRAAITYAKGVSPLGVVDARYNQAATLVSMGQLGAALEVLSRIPRVSQARGMGARIEALKGYIFLQISSYREAYDAYASAVHRLEGTPLDFYERLGFAIATWAFQGPAAAAPMLSSLLHRATSPQQFQRVYHYLAVVFRQLGLAGEALTQIDRALSLRSADARPELTAASLAERALCLAIRGDVGGARAALQDFRDYSSAKDARDIVACYLLAVVTSGPQPSEPLPETWREDYQQRARAAVELAQRQSSVLVRIATDKPKASCKYALRSRGPHSDSSNRSST